MACDRVTPRPDRPDRPDTPLGVVSGLSGLSGCPAYVSGTPSSDARPRTVRTRSLSAFLGRLGTPLAPRLKWGLTKAKF